MEPTFKLGKAPARPGAVTFQLKEFLTKLPKVPKKFGHLDLLEGDLGMYGNAQFGDCVWAGAAHETRYWNRLAKREVEFTDQSVLGDYSTVTGFQPGDPQSDQGTDMEVAAKYRRKTGVVDADGQRHKVAAYLSLDPGNMTQLAAATYLFGAVGLGIQFPDSAMAQFNRGVRWSVVKGSHIEGGHYVPVVGHGTDWYVVTWGKLQRVTAGFITKYADEAIVYLSEEMLTSGKTPEGFDLPALQSALAAL